MARECCWWLARPALELLWFRIYTSIPTRLSCARVSPCFIHYPLPVPHRGTCRHRPWNVGPVITGKPQATAVRPAWARSWECDPVPRQCNQPYMHGLNLPKAVPRAQAGTSYLDRTEKTKACRSLAEPSKEHKLCIDVGRFQLMCFPRLDGAVRIYSHIHIEKPINFPDKFQRPWSSIRTFLKSFIAQMHSDGLCAHSSGPSQGIRLFRSIDIDSVDMVASRNSCLDDPD